MDLSSVVPWGRSLHEYRQMFFLDDSDLQKTILGCGDGPACFNAQWTRMGGNVISVDPIYHFSPEQIRSRINDLYPDIIKQVKEKKDDFIWTQIKSVDELGRIRMDAMTLFLDDFSSAEKGRYTAAALPGLPFDDRHFDLALCSHYLFLYSDQVSEKGHLEAITELCRVADEVRIYPLVDLKGRESRHIGPVLSLLKELNRDVSLQKVAYEFQKGATHMMRIRRLTHEPLV